MSKPIHYKFSIKKILPKQKNQSWTVVVVVSNSDVLKWNGQCKNKIKNTCTVSHNNNSLVGVNNMLYSRIYFESSKTIPMSVGRELLPLRLPSQRVVMQHW